MGLLFVIGIIGCLTCVGVSYPVYPSRYLDPFVGAYAGSGYPYGAGGGAFASAGGFQPYWNYQRPFYPPFMPFMPFPAIPFNIVNWYEGPNVCTETRTSDESKEFNDWLQDDSFTGDYRQQSESCRGTNSKQVCFKRITKNGVTQMQATKYECCHGFVRNPQEPGCMESPYIPRPIPTTVQPPLPYNNKAPSDTDKAWYNIVPSGPAPPKSN